jgi:hypothetical protein
VVLLEEPVGLGNVLGVGEALRAIQEMVEMLVRPRVVQGAEAEAGALVGLVAGAAVSVSLVRAQTVQRGQEAGLSPPEVLEAEAVPLVAAVFMAVAAVAVAV